MNIGAAAKASGVTPKMIRYYESIGLLPKAGRRDSGYRDYGPDDVRRLAFVKRARDLAFSMEDIAELLSLWGDKSRSHAEVRDVAMRHVGELEAQAMRLQQMIATLRDLVACCRKGNVPDCPIIADLDAAGRKLSS
jgi:Cu(I)-responsive transcriptional regulator